MPGCENRNKVQSILGKMRLKTKSLASQSSGKTTCAPKTHAVEGGDACHPTRSSETFCFALNNGLDMAFCRYRKIVQIEGVRSIVVPKRQLSKINGLISDNIFSGSFSLDLFIFADLPHVYRNELFLDIQ